jgi:hypothetical protein
MSIRKGNREIWRCRMIEGKKKKKKLKTYHHVGLISSKNDNDVFFFRKL